MLRSFIRLICRLKMQKAWCCCKSATGQNTATDEQHVAKRRQTGGSGTTTG